MTLLILRIQIVGSEADKDTARAVYLLHTLKSRGVTWPELWWRPDSDGGVCSFLGTVDEAFDARATLTVLEDREEEERLQATRAEIAAQFPAFAGGGVNVGQGGSSQRNNSRQEKRAEARTETKAKEKDSKQTKG